MELSVIKKSIGAVLMCLFSFSIDSSAQAMFTHEKTLDGQYSVQMTQYDDNDNYEDQLPYVTLTAPSCDMGYYYYTACSGNTYTMNLVSPDYVVSKKTYTFDIPSGCTLGTCYPTNKLTEDKSLVFFLTYYWVSANGTLYSCGLFDSDGKLIQQFVQGVNTVSVYPMLFRQNDAYKLIVRWGNYNTPNYTIKYKTDIYTFDLSNITQVNSIQDARLLPYPVPSSTVVNIPYSSESSDALLHIFDNNGMLIEIQNLKEKSGTAYVNVMTYRPGIYLYKIGRQTGRFVVN